MTERGALGLAALGHVLLLGALSVSLARTLPMQMSVPDVIPVEFVEIGAETTVTRPPEPSMEAAPRDPGPPPPPAPEPQPAPPTPAPAPAPEKAPVVEDKAAQDAVPEQPKAAPRPTPKPAPKPAPPKTKGFDAGAMAALIDKSLLDAPARPRDPSAFAKSIEQAIPQDARISPRAMATLEQAIRAQVAPCWNPPTGGADVREMTVVLKIRLNRDGTVIGQPEFVSQTGQTAGNQAYARAFVESARRAVLRCTPLDLPDDLYRYWREFELNFDPRLMI